MKNIIRPIAPLIVLLLILTIFSVAVTIVAYGETSIEPLNDDKHIAVEPETVIACPENTISEECSEPNIIEETVPTFNTSIERDIYIASKNIGFDPYTALAISALETGRWTSYIYINGYNFGGLTGKDGLMYFETYDDGLDAYMNTLSYYNGMSIDGMAHIYCPYNAEDWTNLVYEIRSEYM